MLAFGRRERWQKWMILSDSAKVQVRQWIPISISRRKSISAFPSGGTEIGDRWKEQSPLNLTAFQELVKRLSTAGSLEEALRIQTAFMHSQLNRLGKQATSFGATYTKTADNADKKSSD